MLVLVVICDIGNIRVIRLRKGMKGIREVLATAFAKMRFRTSIRNILGLSVGEVTSLPLQMPEKEDVQDSHFSVVFVVVLRTHVPPASDLEKLQHPEAFSLLHNSKHPPGSPPPPFSMPRILSSPPHVI